MQINEKGLTGKTTTGYLSACPQNDGLSGGQTRTPSNATGSWKAGLLVIIVGLMLAWPVLNGGFPCHTHDARYHPMWAWNFAKQFWAGEAYPRWLMDLNGGLGSPTFFYYPPLPYWITALFHPLFPDEISIWCALGFSAGLGLVLSGLLAFAWLRRHAGVWPAALGGVCYMAAPYHLLTDLYTRGAFVEFWAITWLPLVLWAVDRVAAASEARTPRTALATLALAYAILVMTHLATTLIFSLVPLAYAPVVAAHGFRLKATLWVSLGLSLGAGLAAIFLVPAMTTQQAVSMEALGQFHYAASFFFVDFDWGRLAHRNTFRSELFRVVGLTLAAAVCGLFLARQQPAAGVRRQAVFWAAVAVLCVFMMVPLSKPVWVALPKLQVIQFPWRFAAVLTPAVAALLALGAGVLNSSPPWSIVVPAQAAWICVAGWLVWTASIALPVCVQLPGEPNPLVRDAPEYRVRGVTASLDQALSHFGDPTGGETKVVCDPPGGKIVMNHWKPRDILFSLELTNPATISLRRYWYPGWVALVNGRSVEISHSAPEGLLGLHLPEGSHQVALRLPRTRAEQAGAVASLFSAVIVALLFVGDLAARRRACRLAQPAHEKSMLGSSRRKAQTLLENAATHRNQSLPMNGFVRSLRVGTSVCLEKPQKARHPRKFIGLMPPLFGALTLLTSAATHFHKRSEIAGQ